MARKKRRRAAADRTPQDEAVAGRTSQVAGGGESPGGSAASGSTNADQSAGRRPRAARPVMPMPSTTARLSGLALAAVTAFLAVLLIRTAISDSSGADAVVRIIVGAALVLLAIVVAALVIAPAQIRRWLGRRSAAGR